MSHRPDWAQIRVVLDDREQIVGSPDALRDLLAPYLDMVVKTDPGAEASNQARIRLGRVLMQIRAALPRRGWIRYVESAIGMNRNTIRSCQKMAARWYAEGGRDVMDAEVIDRLRAKIVAEHGCPATHPAITTPMKRIHSKHLEVLLGIRSWKSTNTKTNTDSDVQTSHPLGVPSGSFDPSLMEEPEFGDGVDDEDDDLPPPLGYTREGVEIVTSEDIDSAEEDGDITPALAAQYRAELARREADDGGQDPADRTRAGAVVDGGDPDRPGVVAGDPRDAGDVDRGADPHLAGPAERLVPPAAHRLALVSDQASGPATEDGRVRAGAAVSRPLTGALGAIKPRHTTATQLTLGELYEHAENLRKVAERAVDAMRSGDRAAASGSLAELRDLVQALEREVA